MCRLFLIEEHSKGTAGALEQSKSTPRALGHSRQLGTPALEAFGHWALEY